MINRISLSFPLTVEASQQPTLPLFPKHIFILPEMPINFLPFFPVIDVLGRLGLVYEVAAVSIEAIAIVDEGKAGACFI